MIGKSLKLLAGIILIPLALAASSDDWVNGSSPRSKVKINLDWKFYKGDTLITSDFRDFSENLTSVDLPHSWNVSDPFDEEKGYYRGVAWYYKNLSSELLDEDKNTYLYLEGANQTAQVFVNGQLIQTHKGGYTAFCVNLTPYLNFKEDVLAIKLNNEHDESIVPLKGDFNFYGGIYRDAYLISVDPVHFDLSDHASPGIFIETPTVSKQKAEIRVRSKLKLNRKLPKGLKIRTVIRDSKNNTITESTVAVTSKVAKEVTQTLEVSNPSLWSPDHPTLYTVTAQLIQSGVLTDEITQSIGLRWFDFDPDDGFFLNGEPLKLVGVNRHQDFAGMANALPDDYHVRDIEMIKSLGANFLRTAHYPQDPAVLEACDRLGLLVSMEIPLDHEITDSQEFYDNTLVMQREMIRQNYNHPSIIIWAYMNEMFLGKRLDRDSANIYQVVRFARQLEKLTREEDPSRYTMIPNHGDFDVYHQSGLTQIPMIVGWNLYYGWYEEDLNGFGKFIDRAHQVLTDKPLIITEYGAGADPRIRSMEPKRFDFSIEWETQFHKSHLRQIQQRKFVAGAAVWNMFDFGSESRNDAVPNINSKGLCTFDRKPKDVYYLYKAWLSPEPVLELGQSDWSIRSGSQDNQEVNYSTQQVQAYGNADSVRLIFNLKTLPWKKFENGVANWEVPFVRGINQLEISAQFGDQIIERKQEVDFKLICNNLSEEFAEVNVNLGTNFYFLEKDEQQIWIPEKPYDSGWGFIGGYSFSPRDRGIGSDRNIVNTLQDPVYQTQRVGIDTLRFDLKDGHYKVRMLFSELENIAPDQRIFSIWVNGQQLIEELDLMKHHGAYLAVEKVFDVDIQGDGLSINFEAIAGEPVINGIRIEKL
ncbi:MAG: glycoside hydrolase family 2 TIM barrel-domain containing protein [Reichenbachiella sp.]|uniref:glycoside hydrolase family 2 TIM barrel-domain containing protein n=4 Tax=Reichenbachiella sp. TaxID=2184521 RepID=UPI00326557BA